MNKDQGIYTPNAYIPKRASSTSPPRSSTSSVSVSPPTFNSWDNRTQLRIPIHSSRRKSPTNESFDPIKNCKSAGIIPFSFHNGEIVFLFQREVNPRRNNSAGWNDFGGKKGNIRESTFETASREFSEETSCLFYLVENSTSENIDLYQKLKDNPELKYPIDIIDKLKHMLPSVSKYFCKKLESDHELYVSSKDIYISYLMYVEYIPIEDLPRAEDFHIDYEDRYMRECKWVTLSELMEMSRKEFHKRLQITNLQNNIKEYDNKNLFMRYMVIRE